jgi:hypothetical protein
MFDGTQVDGIHFEKILSFSNVVAFSGQQRRFNNWKTKFLVSDADNMMDEYIRLTNIAFGVNCMSPPVFLLDEIQGLCKPTTIQSMLKGNGNQVNHSFLSFLLTQLAGKHKPVCICVGTNSGNIMNITERSKIYPQFVSLTTLHADGDSRQFWLQRTRYFNKSSSIKAEITDGDEDMINSLVYVSYQIPRLLLLAHHAWFVHRTNSSLSDLISPLQAYEDNAARYYQEMAEVLYNDRFEGMDIPHILLCCGVHWKVRDINSCVPGTKHKWSFLIEISLIFPYLDNCYIFPFQLMWQAKTPSSRQSGDHERTKKGLTEVCESLIPNFDISNLFVSYDNLRQQNLYNLGMCYETLFASSMAVKYYLCKLKSENQQWFPILDLYDIGREDISSSKSLESILVNFSSGMHLPIQEAFVNSTNLPPAVIHNCNIQSAHHDIILPSKIRSNNVDTLVNIPVSCKASFRLSSSKAIENQSKTSKQNDEVVDLLIWLYLGNEKREENHQGKVVFLNGGGCCNGLALDMFILTKKLISQNNI